jgi:putative membrane protein insertion efficiency factor
MTLLRRFVRSLLLMLAAGLVLARPASSLADGMNGPPKKVSHPIAADGATADTVSQPLLGAIRFFQEYISPLDGARCQFSPTCSAYGHQAIHQRGPWLGVLMTTDRLMRCGYLSEPDTYPRLPNGRLADPVAAAPEND